MTADPLFGRPSCHFLEGECDSNCEFGLAGRCVRLKAVFDENRRLRAALKKIAEDNTVERLIPLDGDSTGVAYTIEEIPGRWAQIALKALGEEA